MSGRPREYDVDEVLDAAMHTFWANGYESTSLTDLVAATGLLKGSLYQAFGDKHGLFVQSLHRYLQNMSRRKNQLLEQAPTPLDGIRSVLHGIIDIADADSECPKGCMAINSLIELVPGDAKVRNIMIDHQKRMQSSMVRTVVAAQAAGQIGKEKRPELITSLLMTFLAGLVTTMKGPLSNADAHKLLDAQLDVLI